MMQKFLMTRRSMLFSLVGLMLTTMLTIWGCGGSSSTGSGNYSAPEKQVVTTTVTKSGNALVEADELKRWIDEGKVNAPFINQDRVVILDVGNADYKKGHIPGAQDIAAGSAAFMDNTRAEGPFNVTGNMVATGEQIDALVQKAGINGNTTIVLTATGNTINVARAYATLRYWGFDKSRLKVLQGGNAAWTAANYAYSVDTPVVTASAFSVAPASTGTRINTAMRVSLSEMIAQVKEIVAGNPNNVTILDTIRPANQITSTTDLIDATKYTPMEGAIKGSYRFPYADVVDPVKKGMYFKDAATLLADISAGTDSKNNPMGNAKRDATKTFIVQCRAGNAASVAYFVLDGIAYYNSSIDVKWYDGSYGQWNLLVSKDKVGTGGKNAGGQLVVGSIWDATSLMDNLTYSVDRLDYDSAKKALGGTDPRPVVEYAGRTYFKEPTFEEGNQIENTDRAYRSKAITTNTGTSGGSAGGGC